MAEIQNIIKSIQNIMRKDAGVDGDALRLSQLAWMLFLKIFDDHEKQRETIDTSYRSPIPEKLRWRNWAADKEGITGDDLSSFIDKELFPTLRNLSVKVSDSPAAIVRSVFVDSYNYMKNGTLMRQVINQLQEINFNKQADRHQFGDVYEKLLKDLQSAGNYGEFYTPRPLTNFIVEMVAPALGESILDPACGTGGFLVNALEYVRKHEVKTAAEEKRLESSIYGTELKGLPHLLATTNFLLHDVENPSNLKHDDMLAKPLNQITPSDRVDVIVANPPFGASVADGTQGNFPAEYRTKDTALLFLLLFIYMLKPQGRAGIVLPDGVLFGEGVASKIKEKLLTECNVHTIVRLPPGVFAPYAGVNTNLVFFEKGMPTKEVWYYQLPLPEGVRAYTKGRPIQYEEFDVVRKWWGGAKRAGRKAGPQAWKVAIEEIKAKNWSLDLKNPTAVSSAAHRTPAQLLAQIAETEQQILSILGDMRGTN